MEWALATAARRRSLLRLAALAICPLRERRGATLGDTVGGR